MNKSISGIVQDGLGQGAGFTQLDWVRAQFRNKFGFDPHPGTLNVCVDDVETLNAWRTQPGIGLEPTAGFCAARCYSIVLNDLIAGVWMIPEVPYYPMNLVEIMAAVSLRQVLGVKSGDSLRIQMVEEIE